MSCSVLRPMTRPSLEFAAVAEHLGEAEVILGGAEQAVAAALKRLRRVDGIGLREIDALVHARCCQSASMLQNAVNVKRIGAAVAGCEAATFIFGDAEAGVDHAQRIEQALLQHVGERLAGDRLDQPRRRRRCRRCSASARRDRRRAAVRRGRRSPRRACTSASPILLPAIERPDRRFRQGSCRRGRWCGSARRGSASAASAPAASHRRRAPSVLANEGIQRATGSISRKRPSS